jgi:DNA-binding HxlR family transcriptional regulator
MPPARRRAVAAAPPPRPAATPPPPAAAPPPPEAAPQPCCPHLHEAVELVGRRWTGAIVTVLRQSGPLRFSEVGQAVPELSDRLLAARMRELEARGIVVRATAGGRARYALTDMGRELGPALDHLAMWARRWLV